ncbi:MAG: hypothetical protein GXP40_08890 [Chloroflexi bacterium]|nr:hypothetical protein [Chloroflexota bacterium]
MTRLRYPLPLLLILLLAVSCNGKYDPATPLFGGEIGIPFRNGVECLGEEAQPVPGDSVYVSPTGNDSHSGGTAAAPLGTLAYALCNLRPGQTLYVLPGRYRESVVMGIFGDQDMPITIRGVLEGGRRPVLDGESTRTMGIALVESTNIVVENLEFRGYTDEGLYILAGSNFTIRDNLFAANGRASIDPDADGEGFGVNVEGASQVLIENNEAARNGPNAERWQAFTLGTGINTFELRDSVVRGNYVHDTTGGGILVEDGTNVLVEDNRIENNELDANGDYWDGGIWVDGGQHITLRGNVITGNHGPGITMSDEEAGYPASSFGYIVEDNVISGNLVGVFVWNWGQCPAPENAVRFVDNQIEGNAEDDAWCEEWMCGVEQACE